MSDKFGQPFGPRTAQFRDDTDSGRVEELIALYSAANASAAELLCDHHNPAALAYRIVDAQLVTQSLSYGELRKESERFAAGLQQLGAGPGTRVATLMGKGRAYLVALMGIWRLGAVHVPLFTAFAPPAIALRLDGSDARIVICDQSQEEKLRLLHAENMLAGRRIVTTGEGSEFAIGFDALMVEAPAGIPAARLGGEAPIIHIYTSGTTGKPKGVVVPLRAVAAFRAYAEFALDLRSDDMFWCSADPGWAYGLYFGILATLSTGTASVMFTAGFAPATTLAVLETQKVTNFSAAPTVYRSLRSSGLEIPSGISLRCASSAGEPLTAEVNEWASRALGVIVHDHYGQTEAGMLINNHHRPSLRHPVKPGSMGHPMPGWTASVIEETGNGQLGNDETGRVVMDMTASPLAWFRGYDADEEGSAGKFAGNGRWYLTGDTGWRDEDGYYHFSARDDDVIIMAGYRIGPFEVESILASHPEVIEVAVVAVPDPLRGEVIEAFVVPRDLSLADEALVAALQLRVKEKFAAHAYPRRIHFTDALPKTPSGKTQRFVLKQQRLREMAAEAGKPL